MENRAGNSLIKTLIEVFTPETPLQRFARGVAREYLEKAYSENPHFCWHPNLEVSKAEQFPKLSQRLKEGDSETTLYLALLLP